MFKAFWQFIFKIFGWKVVGHFPFDTRKTIIVAAPHTSNWDFFVGLGTRSILRFNSSFLIKKSWLSKPVIGALLRKAGGVGVDRSKNVKLTDQIAEIFNQREEFRIAIAPEGTRKYNPDWKTGFWHIAKKANIPLLPVTFNYVKKEVEFLDLFHLTDDKDSDIERLKSLYRDIPGKNPELGVR
ncbi:MAG: 1-acyl-sn-glycerol-3-phosphate acyltransferase [Saprospiraceae bacterium]|nr:1-acyl-sn-glycerol-3-phosphate acyltransferase [Saprospiraceae bacterium]